MSGQGELFATSDPRREKHYARVLLAQVPGFMAQPGGRDWAWTLHRWACAATRRAALGIAREDQR